MLSKHAPTRRTSLAVVTAVLAAAVCNPALLGQEPSPATPAATRPPATAPATQSNEQLAQPASIEATYPLDADATRKKSVQVCQQLVVDLLVTFNDYKEAHWNLNGPLYLVLHEYYQGQADYYRGQADVFAERALSLGYSVDGRYSTIARTTTLPEMPAGFITDSASLRLMLDRVAVLQKEVYAGIKTLNDSDPVTANKLQDLAYVIDKNLWQLRIHLARPGSPGETLPWAAGQTRDTAESPPTPDAAQPGPAGAANP